MLSVAKSAVLHEEAVLNGTFSFKAKHPFLGLTDEEVPVLLNYVAPHADVCLPHAFRSFKFSRSRKEYIEFAEKWRVAFQPATSVLSKVEAAKAAMNMSYSCLHARLQADSQHGASTSAHGNISAELAWLKDSVRNASGAVYIASDIYLSDWMRSELHVDGSKRLFTCVDFGCKPESFDDAVRVYMDSILCASAYSHNGNRSVEALVLDRGLEENREHFR